MNRDSRVFVNFFYYASIALVFVGVVGFIIFKTTDIKTVTVDRFGNCMFEDLTGIFCPGCGMTRSMTALIDLKPVKSLLYHVLPICAICCVLYIIIKETTYRVFGNKRKLLGLNDREIINMIVALIFIVLFQWVFKLVLLFGFHIKTL